MEFENLFGDGLEIKIKETSVKDLLKKKSGEVETDPEKILKSKKLSLIDKLAVIKENVLKILGHYKDNILVIKDRKTFDDYIDEAIKSGRIAIDTETNNSLDPRTCRLMGLCLYYSGGKQAYVPVNHTDLEDNKLDWQLTEDDCRQELERVNESGIKQIFHNGKFDYEVLLCTCGVKVNPYWDTMIGARLLNENEEAKLKVQYIKKIDPNQSKYDIENLFEHISYAYVDPDIFAYYAATDAYLTDRLYEYQDKEFSKPEYGPHLDMTGKHELMGLRWLFHEVEMPISVITGDMELAGVAVDTEYGERLKKKYEAQLAEVDVKINTIMDSLEPIVAAWKLTPEANKKLKVYASKKSKMSPEKLLKTYPEEDDLGRFKYGKTAVEQLENPIKLSSPTQLAILFYDILGVPNSAKDGSKKTGKDELKEIKDKLKGYLPALEEIQTEFDEDELEDEDITEALQVSDDKMEAFKFGNAAKLTDLILTRRGIEKLITTYIDVIPDLTKHWPDGRIRFHLNSAGTDTGRYSSGGKLKFMENGQAIEVSGINIQNIPSHVPEIRMLFKAQTTAKLIEVEDNEPFVVAEISEVETPAGWKYCRDLAAGDSILVNNVAQQIKAITYNSDLKNYLIEV